MFIYVTNKRSMVSLKNSACMNQDRGVETKSEEKGKRWIDDI